jgi:nicotinamide-nucleotide amidase
MLPPLVNRMSKSNSTLCSMAAMVGRGRRAVHSRVMTTRAITTAEILAVGTELLVGETRDTNSGDLAVELTALGVDVMRISDLPDRQDLLVEAIRAALSRTDLVITSGGLGPTPDDLTREAIAEALGDTPVVDPDLEAWLRDIWDRRGLPFSDVNLKQAWLIPGASALPNPNGTAPGWWVETAGQVVIALPGPPRELQPMWRDHALPRLHARGLGTDRAAETLRLTGIGESAVVDLIGEAVLRASQPQVATYARVDAVDLRVSAVGEPGRSARVIVDEAVAGLMPLVEPYVFARGDEGWPDALTRRLGRRRLATVEIGTSGQLGALLGAASWLASAELVGPGAAVDGHDLERLASAARTRTGVEAGLAVHAVPASDDMRVEVAVDLDGAISRSEHTVFRGGEIGRRRAANTACAALWARLGDP